MKKVGHTVKFILDTQPNPLWIAERKPYSKDPRHKFSNIPLYKMKQFKAEEQNEAKRRFI